MSKGVHKCYSDYYVSSFLFIWSSEKRTRDKFWGGDISRDWFVWDSYTLRSCPGSNGGKQINVKLSLLKTTRPTHPACQMLMLSRGCNVSWRACHAYAEQHIIFRAESEPIGKGRAKPSSRIMWFYVKLLRHMDLCFFSGGSVKSHKHIMRHCTELRA